MNKSRLEAFSDGVFAIIITIMVLEIKIPASADWSVFEHLLPILASYALSFLFLGIYWVNHHHLMHTVRRVSSGIMWSNLNLLFWLSLVPFATGWMGETHFAQNTVVTYGVLCMLCGVAYTIWQKTIEACHKTDARMEAIYAGQGRKGLFSLVLYAVAIGAAFVSPAVSGVVFLLVSVMWIVPDKNIERALGGDEQD